MQALVPPYFDYLIDGFRRGQGGRHVHLGHWDAPPLPDVPPQPGEFARAQTRLCEILLDLAQLRDGQRVLDVGCGFGGTVELVNRQWRDMALTGVNIDARQLDLCRQIEALHGNRLHWQLADACRLPFADASFERVLCIEAMFHFGSRRAFFAEAARVLKPGGVLVASDIVIAASARALDTPGFQIELPIRDGFGPWPDFWSADADHGALAAAAGLEAAALHDASAPTLPSHRFTAPAVAPEPVTGAARAAWMLHWLHRHGHLRYLYMRFDKPA
ncbi:MAG: class I SAM-dependent methyltransferase [Betaproteobacteria bacterium]